MNRSCSSHSPKSDTFLKSNVFSLSQRKVIFCKNILPYFYHTCSFVPFRTYTVQVAYGFPYVPSRNISNTNIQRLPRGHHHTRKKPWLPLTEELIPKQSQSKMSPSPFRTKLVYKFSFAASGSRFFMESW